MSVDPPARAALSRMLDILLGAQAVQRPALARALGLPRQAVSELMAGLERRGLVQVEGAIDGRPGRSAHSYRLFPGAALAVGMDIGETVTRTALIDLRGHRLCAFEAPTAAQSRPAAWVAALALDACRRARVEPFRLQAASIGIAHRFDRMPGLREDMARHLAQALGCVVEVDHRANLSLVGEMLRRPEGARGTVAYVATEPEIRAAVMVEGALVRGAHGMAGDLDRLFWDGESAGAAAQATARLPARLIEGIDALIAILDPDTIIVGGPCAAASAFEAVAEALGERYGARVPRLAMGLGGVVAHEGALEQARLALKAAVLTKALSSAPW